jgi:hypothetical protein
MSELIVPVGFEGDDGNHPDSVFMSNGDIVSFDYENEIELALSGVENTTHLRGFITEVYIYLDEEDNFLPRPGDDDYPFTNRVKNTQVQIAFADLVSAFVE